ncbi:MAG: hypothetical protein GXO86_14395 [Chlorobi bacterium]|nr:hypothetical protein [Chlorobiota bacterium]
MKHLFFFLSGILFSVTIISQTAQTQMNINDKVLNISVEKITDGYQYSYKQTDKASPQPKFTAISLNRDLFLTFTNAAFKKINGSINESDSTVISKMINPIFIELVANLFNEESDGPIIATLTLKESIPVYTIGKKVPTPTHTLTPEMCYVVFKDGFIEQIKIYGIVEINAQNTSNEKVLEDFQDQEAKDHFKIKSCESYGFTNIYSIGISSVINVKTLYKIKIYIDKSTKPDAGYFILGDAIDYKTIPKYGTRDYSPENGEVELVKGQTIDLRKSSNAKILEFKIFSDIVGFGEDNPNGLVQLELEKRVPINTYRGPFLHTRMGHSFFSFIDFEFTWSKIENKVKYLSLNAYTPQQVDSTLFFIDALQVYRYQIFQLGGEVNLWLLEVQGLKFDFEINLHANFGYARVVDTINYQGEALNIDEPLNSILLAPEIKFVFYPEKRINISVSDKLTRQYFLFDDENFGYKSQKGNELVEGSKWFNTIGLDAYYWPSAQGKIFIRYRLNHELNNIYSNFSQFQIGYSMNINTSKKNK